MFDDKSVVSKADTGSVVGRHRVWEIRREMIEDVVLHTDGGEDWEETSARATRS